MITLTLALAIGWTQSRVAAHEIQLPERFPLGYYDPFGWAAWGDLGPVDGRCRRALAMMQQRRYPEARSLLLAVHQDKPDDLTAIQGLTECARRQQKLPQWLTAIAGEATHHGKLRTDAATPTQLLAYQYALGVMASDDERSGKPSDFKPGEVRNGGEFVYGTYANSSKAFIHENRIAELMYVSQLYARSAINEARRAAFDVLEKDPQFCQMRLLYAESLAVGMQVVWAPPGADVKGRNVSQELEQAAAQAEMVVRQNPTYLPAYYEAGTLTRSRVKAQHYLAFYVQKAPRNTARYEYALNLLTKSKNLKELHRFDESMKLLGPRD